MKIETLVKIRCYTLTTEAVGCIDEFKISEKMTLDFLNGRLIGPYERSYHRKRQIYVLMRGLHKQIGETLAPIPRDLKVRREAL